MGHSKSIESKSLTAIQSGEVCSKLTANRVWLLVVAVLLLIRLIDTPDLWWTLSRGRQVFSGSLTPSSDLLTLDSGGEADWLSGVPFYLSWSLLGHHALAAIPLVAGCLLVGWFLKCPAIAEDHIFIWLILPLLIILLRAGLTADPMLWDLVFLTWLGKLLCREKDKPPSTRGVFVTFLVWGNIGPRPLWGLILLFVSSSTTKNKARIILAAIFGGMINPRGVFAWWDSLNYFSPFLFVEPSQIYDPAWYGLFSQSELAFASVIFLVAWILWIATELRCRFTFQRIVEAAVPLMACIISISNLPFAAMWMLISKSFRVPKISRDSVPHDSLLIRGITCVIFFFVVVESFGVLGSSAGRLAWGIDSINDVRLLNIDQLPQRDKPYVGWTFDRRSVGMIAWLEGEVVAADHPQRALMGGRWNEHAQVVNDMVTSHRAKYQLEDGSWGGWVARLKAWEIELLFVPAASEKMHAALLETPWNPFDLDSSVIPYLNADDITLAQIVVENLRQQGFVESGPWQPTLAMLDSQGWRYDLCAVIGLGPNTESTIRQSRFFRALDIPTASLRILLPVRQATMNSELQTEFQACQVDLAYQEWVTFGVTSELRRTIVRDSNESVRLDRTSQFWQSIQHSDPPGLLRSQALFLKLYHQGNLSEAVQLLVPDNDQRLYARAMLWLELGNSGRAQKEFQALRDQTTDPGLHSAAQFWSEQISPYLSP